jgi:hypothetical protein
LPSILFFGGNQKASPTVIDSRLTAGWTPPITTMIRWGKRGWGEKKYFTGFLRDFDGKISTSN